LAGMGGSLDQRGKSRDDLTWRKITMSMRRPL
jgi:hypothetical protein